MNDEMSNGPDNYAGVQQQVSNDAFVTDTALRIRLDTAQLLFSIENFLEGKHESLERNHNGNLVTSLKSKGTTLANEVGIQRIMSYVVTMINSHTVQGNLDVEEHKMFMGIFMEDLTHDIMVNMYDYGIKQEEYRYIVTLITRMVYLFTSRSRQDKERSHMSNWMVHTENSQSGGGQQKEGLWKRMTSIAK